MSIENPEVMNEEETFAMPTVAHQIVLHFKNLVVGKDDKKIDELKFVAGQVSHVKYTVGKNTATSGANAGVEQDCIKRDSETYTLMIPDFGALLADALEDVEGLDKKEAARVQELVAKHVSDYSRSLADGAVEYNDDGEMVGVTGFATVTNENASFLLAALESFGRTKGAASATVPTAVRDAACESIRVFLQGEGVGEKGVGVIVAATKSYFSPTTVAQLNADALTKIQGRIKSWYEAAGADEKEAYGLFYNRQLEKITKALNPEELEVDIF